MGLIAYSPPPTAACAASHFAAATPPAVVRVVREELAESRDRRGRVVTVVTLARPQDLDAFLQADRTRCPERLALIVIAGRGPGVRAVVFGSSDARSALAPAVTDGEAGRFADRVHRDGYQLAVVSLVSEVAVGAGKPSL
jgi:hypothetical protein